MNGRDFSRYAYDIYLDYVWCEQRLAQFGNTSTGRYPQTRGCNDASEREAGYAGACNKNSIIKSPNLGRSTLDNRAFIGLTCGNSFGPIALVGEWHCGPIPSHAHPWHLGPSPNESEADDWIVVPQPHSARISRSAIVVADFRLVSLPLVRSESRTKKRNNVRSTRGLGVHVPYVPMELKAQNACRRGFGTVRLICCRPPNQLKR